MQNGTLGFSLLASILVIAIIGSIPNVHAVDYPISGEASCLALPADTTWSGNTCTLNNQLIVDVDDELIINFGIFSIFLKRKAIR